MSQSFSNFVSPAANALSSKINYNPLANLASGYKGLNLSGGGAVANNSPMTSTAPTVQSVPKAPLGNNTTTLNGTTYNSAGDPVVKPLIQPTPPAIQPTQTNTPDSTASAKGILQGQIGNAQGAGYGGSDQLQYDASGKIVPKKQADAQNFYATQAQNLGTIANQGTPQVDQARKALLNFQTNQGQQMADISANPNFSADTAGGRSQILAGRYAAELPAYQAAVSNALTSQGQQIMAGSEAARLAQPSGAFPFVFNPLTGGFTTPPTAGGQTGTGATPTFNPSQDAQNFAQQVINGRTTYQQAQQAMNYAGPTANSFLNSAITSAGGDPLKLEATGAATQSNIQIGATASVDANKSVLNNAYAGYLQLQQTTQNIDGFGNLLTQTMQQGGINPFDVKYANQSLAAIRGQLSSEQQAIYDNTLAGLRSRVSGLLAAGGNEIPTAITADAQKILDGSLPLSSLSGVLGRIQQEGNLLLKNQAAVVNTAYQGTQQGVINQPQNATTNSNQPAGWY